MTREDKGGELISHIGPIPILIPPKLFLEGIEFPRILLPRALRGSFVEEESICRMRNENSVVYFLFLFFVCFL